ncbi:MAG TPA: APC family permease, partial [Gemmatirosa sp.]
EVASRFDATGGPYLYARAAFGARVGFVTGWLLLVARLAGGAALCGLLAQYLAQYAPAVGAGAARLAAVVATLAALTAVHVRGIQVAAAVSTGITAAKLLPLVALVVAGAFAVAPARLALGAPPSAPAFGHAVLLLCFGFSGFETVVIAAGESRDPRRDLPAALGVGLLIVALLYVAVQAVCVGAVPQLATAERPLAEAGRRIFGGAAVPVVVAGAVVAIVGTLHTALLAASRLALAMADAGELPAPLARIHPRFRTPAVALVVVACGFFLLTAISTFRGALTVSTAARLIVYGVTCAALPALRRRTDVAPPALRIPLAPLAWGGGLLLVVAVLTGVTGAQARVLVAAVALGCVLRVVTRTRGPGDGRESTA